MECSICIAAATDTRHIFETDYWTVSLAPDQGYLGRSYVTLKAHKATLADLSAEEWLDFSHLVQKVEIIWRDTFGGTPFNWAAMMNNAYQEMPATPHVHWHVRPRYKQSVIINGYEFTDPLYGYHYNSDQRNHINAETFDLILSQLSQNVATTSSD